MLSFVLRLFSREALARGPVVPALVAVSAMASFAWFVSADAFAPPPPIVDAPEPALEEAAPPVTDAPYTAEAKRLLRGLDVGEEVAGWTLRTIGGPVDGAIVMWFERPGVRVKVLVARTDHMEGEAPVAVGAYGTYFEAPVPASADIDPSATPALVTAVSERIDRWAPLPAGM